MLAALLLSVAAPQGSAGGWEIIELADGCGMLSTYEGKGATDLFFYEDKSGAYRLIVRNAGWSVRAGERVPMTFWFDKVPFDGEVVGVSPSSGKHGFGIGGDRDFRNAVAGASGLTIMRGKTVVDDLSLDGSAAGILEVSSCVSRLKAREAADSKEKARLAHIADDPFATEHGAVPRGPASAWITADDYPAVARTQGHEGAVEVRLGVDQTGKVTGCKIAASSGSSILDDATCRLVMRRGRFDPATDASGRAIASEAALRFDWKLAN